MYQQCVEQQEPPDMRPGDVVDHGQFFRNLKKEHVAKRYSEDEDDNPIYGFKVSTRHWKYADRQGQLSVNLVPCIRTAICSIALQPGGEDYFHIALIDLTALNRGGVLPGPLVAQYKPRDELQNRCHFEILPKDGTTLQWMIVREAFDRPFPPGKLPATDEDRARAAQEYGIYRSYCDIRRWIRQKDGTLPSPT